MTDSHEADPHVMGVSVDVYPDATNFGSRLKRQIDPEAQKAGKDLGRSISAPIGRQVADAIEDGVQSGTKTARRAGADTGESYADAFSRKLRDGIDKTLASLPEAKIGADGSDVDKTVAEIRKRLETLRDETLNVDLDDTDALKRIQVLRNQLSALARQLAALRKSGVKVAVTIDLTRAQAELTKLKADLDSLHGTEVTVGLDIDDHGLEAFKARVAEATKGFSVAVDLDTATAQARLDAFSAALAREQGPSVRLDLDTTAALGDLAAFDTLLAEVTRDRTIRIDIDATGSAAQITGLESALDAATRDRLLGINTAPAAASVAALTAEVAKLKGEIDELKRKNVDVPVSLNTTGFAAKLQAAVRAASAALPDVTIGADPHPAQIAIALIKADLVALGDKRVGIDIDAAAALAQIAAVQAALAAVGERNPTIDLQVEVAGATAKLAAFQSEVEAATKDKTLNVDADTGAATAQLALLGGVADGVSLQLVAIGTAGPLIAAALVPALAAAAVAAGALAIAAGIALAAIAVLAIGIIPIVAAFQSLGKQQAASAAATKTSSASTAAAVKAADERIVDSKKAVTKAVQSAADANLAADARVQQSLRAVITANEAYIASLKAIADAREQAVRDQEDLASQVSHNALDTQQNVLDLQKASADLQSTLNNPASTDAQRKQAQLSYDQLLQQQTDLEVSGGRLQQQQQDSDKKGIEGSDKVVAAKKTAAKAKQSLDDAETARDKAKTDRQKTIKSGEDNIATAVANEKKAEEARATAAKGGAAAISTQAAAADDVAKKMGKLTPAAQNLVKYLKSLDFTELFKAAQGFAGPLEAGLKTFLSKMLPTITTFVTNVSTGMGNAFKVLLTAFSSPFWQKFFDWLGETAKTALPLFATAFANIVTGFAGLVQAFAPVSKIIGGGIATLLGDFATWATNLGKNKGFQDFIDYATQNLPAVVDLVKGVIGFVVNLIKALAPLGPIAIAVINAIIGAFNKIPIGVLTTLIVVIVGIAIALGLVAAVMAVLEAPFLLVGVILAALAVGFIYLWTTSETFRTVVTNAFNAVRDAVVNAWNNYIYPALQAMWAFIRDQLWPVVLQFYNDAIKPAFTAIGAILQVVWAIVQPILKSFWAFILHFLIPVIVFLWKYVVVPAFAVIGAVIKVAWAIINPILQAFADIIQYVVGPVIKLLYDGIVKPVFEKIWKNITSAWTDHIKPIFEALGSFIQDKVKPQFEKAVTDISNAWAKLQDFLKLPIDFIVTTIINKGVVGSLKFLADKLGVDTKVAPIPWPPPGWATGGPVFGAGSTTSDSILARLSNDEHVWTAREVAAAGGHDAVLSLRRAALTGRLAQLATGQNAFATGGPVVAAAPSMVAGLPGFADGGVVGSFLRGAKKAGSFISDFTSTAIDTIKDPKKALSKLADKLVGLIPDTDSTFGKILTGVPRKAIESAGKLLGLIDDAQDQIGTGDQGAGGGAIGDVAPWKGTLSADPLLKKMQNFALDQRGKRYLWSAVGPSTYDCSGLVGDLWAIATGNPLYRRYMSTSNMGAGKHGMVDGPGRFTIYLGKGHTAANIDGLHAEAYHGNGTPLAIGHVGTPLSYYYERLHLPGLAGGGPVVGALNNDENRLASFLATGWPEPPVGFDSGGLLYDTRQMPGGFMPVYHGSSTPDAVLTDQQFRDLHTLAARNNTSQTGRALLNVENYHERGADPGQVARDLDWLSRGLG